MILPTDIKEDVLASIRDTTPLIVVEPGYIISLCSSCFQRGYQLRAAMGAKLENLQRHQPYARWVVLLCKDDRQGQQHRTDLELEAWIKRHYNDYIKSGLLALARAEPDVHSGSFHQLLSNKNTSHAAVVMYHRLRHIRWHGGRAPPPAVDHAARGCCIPETHIGQPRLRQHHRRAVH